MVAVLTVVANHLWGQPTGGFVGVDVFFVISGFLITGNLLRTAETTGTVSFRKFYWNRVRRIVPAATVVLLLTYAASVLVFLPFRSEQIGLDALAAFVFASNWRFALQDTDYFNAGDAVSPIQHYWSLSIEEQFYFVWPALIFLISVIVIRKGWTHKHRMQLAGGVMGVIVGLSLAWALRQTSTSPAWAYFDTFARVWELGVGASLAIAAALLAKIPAVVKPVLSWLGLGLIGASLFLLADGTAGFPAPWALLPVTGSALVIAGGVNGEPRYQAFLRNPVSGYIGDISYSLYLVHWPVIVIVAALMDPGIAYSVTTLALSFGLAIASYHFVENPLRRADYTTFRNASHNIRHARLQAQPSTQIAAVGVAALLTASLVAYMVRADAYQQDVLPADALVASPVNLGTTSTLGPATTALQKEINAALQVTEWPQLTPPIEAVIGDGPEAFTPFPECTDVTLPDPVRCTWGADTAPKKAVIVGNSVAVYYAIPLRDIALNSGGQLQVHTMAMFGCSIMKDQVVDDDPKYAEACPGRKQAVIDYINATKPDIVFISNHYGARRIAGASEDMGPDQWSESIRGIVDQFRGSTRNVVLLAPPPGDVDIRICYGKRDSSPASCTGKISSQWNDYARADRHAAELVGGKWIDSTDWFCSGGYCPSFVGNTPTKKDLTHLVPAYGSKIHPVIAETLREAGVL